MGIIIIETKDDLKAHVKATTAKYRDVKVEEPALPEFAKERKAVFDRNGFAAPDVKKGLGELLSVIVKQATGFVVDFATPQSEFNFDNIKDSKVVKFTAIVPLDRPNNHSYPIDEPCIARSDPRELLLRKEGGVGNSLGGKWRWATDEEIDKFFDEYEGKDIVSFFA